MGVKFFMGEEASGTPVVRVASSSTRLVRQTYNERTDKQKVIAIALQPGA